MRTAALLLLSILFAGRAASALAQGYSPEEAAARMTAADGLAVSLVASEPLVRQPVAIEFDDRGRLWVIQYLQYPNPAGLTRVKVDRYSRTVYDRVPEPPPHGPRGADRITILEDTDGDGRMDRGRDFLDGLNLTTGIAFGHGGVFVLNVPYLLFYPDLDRDDVPDGDPRVLLSGFGMEDSHSVANSLAWGPDGWLYGCQGSTVTANIRGIEFQQGVWRYHPLRDEFELFCEGGGNSWGLDFDRHGQLLYSTNYGGHVLLHAAQGGYFVKNFGKHGALHNPHAYGYFEHAPHANFRGGHVTSGGVLYQETLFGPAYRDRYIAADLLGHAVYWHEIAARGSTFATAHGGDLLVGNDTWFAPCDVTIGPDGAVYVADWHDARTAHPDPDAEWDRTNGRIYRIAPRDGHTVASLRSAAGALVARALPNFERLPSETLVDLLAGDGQWRVRRARETLARRRDPAVWPRLLEQAASVDDEHAALEGLWALYVSGGWTNDAAMKLLDSSHEHARAWTVRLLGDAGEVSPALAARLDRLAELDSSVVVRCQLAATAIRLPAEQALPIVNSIVLRGEDTADPYVPLLLWWAVERHCMAAPEDVLARFAVSSAFTASLARDTILPRLVRRYAAEGTAEALEYCRRLVFAAPDEPRRDALLAALDEGLRESGSQSTGPGGGDLFRGLGATAVSAVRSAVGDAPPPLPPALRSLIDDRWSADRDDVLLLRLAARTGNDAAIEHALAVAADGDAGVERRVELLSVLTELAAETHAPRLLPLATAAYQPEAVQQAALAALGRFADEGIGHALLAKYPTWPAAVRGRACDLLLSRRETAALLLDAIDSGAVEPADVTIDQLRRVALLGDDDLSGRVRKRWGNVAGGTPEEKLAEMRRLSNDLRAFAGDAVAGQAAFKKRCASCHQLFGEGTRIGPDLTTANRQDRDYLLVSLVDPSAVVRSEYLNYVLQTTDGRVLTGLIAEQTPAAVTLLDAKNARTSVRTDEIDVLEESPVSLMPENLHRELTPQELRDLFAYLQR